MYQSLLFSLVLILGLQSTFAFECPNKLEGQYANTEDCSSFFRCRKGVAYKHVCPSGLYFNQQELVCDFPENSECVLTSNGATNLKERKFDIKSFRMEDIIGVLTSLSFCVGLGDGEYRNPEDCGTFYHCSNELTYLKDCPSILHFSEATRRCEWPQDANCTVDSVTTTTTTAAPNTTTTTTTVGPTSPVEGGNFTCDDKECGRYPDEGDCSGYWICGEDKIPEHKECPEGLLFNPDVSDCDLPGNVTCSGSTTETPTTTTAVSNTTTTTTSNPTTTTAVTDITDETTPEEDDNESTTPAVTTTTENNNGNRTTTTPAPVPESTTEGDENDGGTTPSTGEDTTPGNEDDDDTTTDKNTETTQGEDEDDTTPQPTRTTPDNSNKTTTTTRAPEPETTTERDEDETTPEENDEDSTTAKTTARPTTTTRKTTPGEEEDDESTTEATSGTSTPVVKTTTLSYVTEPEEPEECAACGLFGNPRDCSRYFLCAEGLKVELRCHAGLRFDSLTLECVAEEEAHCVGESLIELPHLP